MILLKRVLAPALLLLLLIALVAGCGPREEATEVVLGYTGPLSGPGAEYGQDGLNGIDMAVHDINEAGGIEIDGKRYKFKVVSYDDESNPTNSIANVERLLDVDGASVIYNMVYTCTAPMLEINLEEGHEFIVMAYTSVPVEYDHANKLAIWIPPPFTAYAEAMTRMGRAEGWEVCAAVVDSGSYGQLWADTFEKYWEGYGGTFTVAEIGNYYTDQDYSTQITTALATDPDALLIGGPSGGTMLVVEQARELGFEGGFIVLDQAKMDWIALKLGSVEPLENSIGVVPPETSHEPFMKEFHPRYTDEYVEKGKATVNTWEAAINYSATWALVKAMEAAGSVDDLYAIVEALETSDEIFPLSNHDYPYEYGGISDGGRLYGWGAICIVKDGEFGPGASILWWPEDEEDFAAWVEKANINPAVDPIWIKYPPQ